MLLFFQAAILQQTAEYIYQLEQEKTRLLSQNCQLKRLINQHEGEANSALKKRKTDAGKYYCIVILINVHLLILYNFTNRLVERSRVITVIIHAFVIL